MAKRTSDKTAMHLVMLFCMMLHLPLSVLLTLVFNNPIPIITFVLGFYIPNISRRYAFLSLYDKHNPFTYTGAYDDFKKSEHFILLAHPHGLFGSAGCLFSRCHEFPHGTIMLIDKKVYFSSPVVRVYLGLLSGLSIYHI